jgi:ketosteroid isomerase-like protein
MRTREHRCRVRLLSGLAIAAPATLVAIATLALAACGGSSSNTSSSPTITVGNGGSTSPSTTPSAAAPPQRLVGSDSVAMTSRVVDGSRAALRNPTVAKSARIYADDVVFDDYCYGMHGEGRADTLRMIRKNLREYTSARWVAGYAGRGWAVIEEYWDFTKTYGASVAILAVFETRGGKVVHEGDYEQDFQNLPNGRALEPRALKTAPGPADTAAAAEDVVLRYSAALQAKDAAAVAALSAPKVAFVDTASSTMGSEPDEVRAHFAAIFTKPSDLAFTNLRYTFGRGWAALIWTAASQSFAATADGVTVLEIRDGKVARETLYYNGAKVPFLAPAG